MKTKLDVCEGYQVCKIHTTWQAAFEAALTEQNGLTAHCWRDGFVSVVGIFDGGRWTGDGMGGRAWIDGPQIGVSAVADIETKKRNKAIPLEIRRYFDGRPDRVIGLSS